MLSILLVMDFGKYRAYVETSIPVYIAAYAQLKRARNGGGLEPRLPVYIEARSGSLQQRVDSTELGIGGLAPVRNYYLAHDRYCSTV